MFRSLTVVAAAAASAGLAALPAQAERPSAAGVSAGAAQASRAPATSEKRRHRRRPGCGKYCRQAGGFGAGPDSPPMPVRIASQTVRVASDGIVGVRAQCHRSRKCVGAILLDGHMSYGRADLSIPAHKTRTVLVAVTSKGRRYLARHGGDHQVYATVPLKSAKVVSFSKKLTLLPHG